MDVTKLDDTNEDKPLDEVGQLVDEAQRAVTELVDAHPFGTLLGALGAGYLLGHQTLFASIHRLSGGEALLHFPAFIHYPL